MAGPGRKETLRNRDLGVRTDRSYLTLNEYLYRWLQDAFEPKVRANTYRSHRDCLRLHVRGLPGGIPLEKLRPLDVQNAVTQIREKGLSPRTVQYRSQSQSRVIPVHPPHFPSLAPNQPAISLLTGFSGGRKTPAGAGWAKVAPAMLRGFDRRPGRDPHSPNTSSTLPAGIATCCLPSIRKLTGFAMISAPV